MLGTALWFFGSQIGNNALQQRFAGGKGGDDLRIFEPRRIVKRQPVNRQRAKRFFCVHRTIKLRGDTNIHAAKRTKGINARVLQKITITLKNLQQARDLFFDSRRVGLWAGAMSASIILARVVPSGCWQMWRNIPLAWLRQGCSTVHPIAAARCRIG